MQKHSLLEFESNANSHKEENSKKHPQKHQVGDYF